MNKFGTIFWQYVVSRRRLLYLLVIFLIVDWVFAYLFPETGTVFLYATLVLGFFALCVLIWDFAMTFQDYRKAALYEEIEAASPLEHLLYEKYTEEQQARLEEGKTAQAKFNDLMDYYTLWVHQIKTPIAASQLLVQDVETPIVKQQMEQELFKIDSYANLVLQYLRLESFHDDLVLKRVSVEDMVKEVVRKYALFFIQKNLTVDLHDLEQEVITDRKWLLVIIEQLLSNSLKYTSTGGIEIYFKDQTLYIKDSGIGIKNSDVLRVFERGFSGYNGHMTQQSSGLGLYLSKKIAEQLGHKISLHSEVGQGTTVAIRFEEKKLMMD